MTDIGTGTYAILRRSRRKGLGCRWAYGHRLGDTDLPAGAGSGGSGASILGDCGLLACRGVRETVAERARVDESALTLKDGVATGGNVRRPLPTS